MEYQIKGELAQVVELTFSEGETCWASKGSLMSHTPQVSWDLRVPGGLGGAAKRVLSGEGITLTYLQSGQAGQKVLLASNQPGKIVPWDLDQGPILTTRGSFVAAFGPSLDITVVVAKRAGAAFFGGAGLFLQKISGRGTVLVHGAGDFIDRELAPGESMLLSTGNLAAFAEEVDYNIQGVGSVRKVFFGGEGLFMTRLTGPGRVLLQTLKRSNGAARQPSAGS